jgi:hypothetical protein
LTAGQSGPTRWPDDRAYRGHEGMRKLGAAFPDNFDRWEYELRRTRVAGDRVIALSEMSGQIKISGDPISQAIVLVVADFRDETFGEVARSQPGGKPSNPRAAGVGANGM